MTDQKFEYIPESHVFDKQLPPLIYNNNHQSSNDLQQQQQQQPNNHHHHIQQSQQNQQQLLQPKIELNEPINLKNIIGRISSKDNVLFITDKITKIGRSSTTSIVQFNVGKNRFVSRRHLNLKHEQQTGDFFMTCSSKNGIFIDGRFYPKTIEPIRLTKECTFRFASTDLLVKFENLYNKKMIVKSEEISPIKTENENFDMNNIKMEEILPKIEVKSPIRTQPFISCPTSPSHSFQDYSNSTSTNDLFQTPSTSIDGDDDKPPYSYAQLIVQSITASTEKQLTLSGIYSFIASTYTYYRNGANKGWQNSIRHNLSLNRCFIKVPRSQDEPGKGSFWRIDPNSEMKLIDQSFKKRRQRYRNPLGRPRSAPVSPSAIDLLLHFGDSSSTRGNSPVNDITMHAGESSSMSYENGLNYDSQIKQGNFNSSYFSTSVKRESSGDMMDDNYSDSAEE